MQCPLKTVELHVWFPPSWLLLYRSGKTLAFGLPILHHTLGRNPSRCFLRIRVLLAWLIKYDDCCILLHIVYHIVVIDYQTYTNVYSISDYEPYGPHVAIIHQLFRSVVLRPSGSIPTAASRAHFSKRPIADHLVIGVWEGPWEKNECHWYRFISSISYMIMNHDQLHEILRSKHI